MKQILFFGLKDDLLTMLDLVESKGALRYVRTGNFSKDEIRAGISEFPKGAMLSNLGRASAESSAICETFLVCDNDTRINLRTAGRGGERVCIDQLANPDSVAFTPGGIWNEDVVLYGRVATVSESDVSQALMKRFQAAIRKTFSKVRGYHVGPNALALLKAGKRLTISAQSPPEFDLAFPEGEN
jgi:hypothetical protein